MQTRKMISRRRRRRHHFAAPFTQNNCEPEYFWPDFLMHRHRRRHQQPFFDTMCDVCVWVSVASLKLSAQLVLGWMIVCCVRNAYYADWMAGDDDDKVKF